MTKKSKGSAARGPREGSIVDQLLKLEVDETLAVARPLDGEVCDSDAIGKMKRQMVSGASKNTQRARKVQKAFDFYIETGVTVTSQNGIYVTAIITRIK